MVRALDCLLVSWCPQTGHAPSGWRKAALLSCSLGHLSSLLLTCDTVILITVHQAYLRKQEGCVERISVDRTSARSLSILCTPGSIKHTHVYKTYTQKALRVPQSFAQHRHESVNCIKETCKACGSPAWSQSLTPQLALAHAPKPCSSRHLQPCPHIACVHPQSPRAFTQNLILQFASIICPHSHHLQPTLPTSSRLTLLLTWGGMVQLPLLRLGLMTMKWATL